ncbi:ABC transporter substrate-binding protein [Paenibacillus yonginensis]|uniref:ABC transporter substrate-binding protein n=1 Tax=Paenibacillus yonginensis TaxID=1462996 RepID=A0A1B1MVS8_9BACL|nr:ABC transporter substrate-binding protein [Paenibacillus yonginensis]ANS73247.1 ABC transporter substrate-binding protein [Paenibacillus yonginensis]
MKGRLFRSGVSCLLAMVILLSACSSKGNEEASPASAEAAVTEAGQFPIVNEPVTIKVMTAANSAVEDFATNKFTKYLEEKTNIHIEWELVPGSSAAEKLNVVLAGGDLPDVIMGMNVSNDQQQIYGEQGVFLSLNDLIDKYGIETKKMFEERPLIKESITASDGKIYALPAPNECYHCSMRQKMWIYQPWLDKLGLKMPTTTEEFYEVLKAFKTQDPNGNGKADEIPFSGAPMAYGSTTTTAVENFLMNAFTYAPYTRIYLNEGKADVPYNKDGWRQGLEYLHKLYAEGLMDPQALTQDGTQLMQLGENPGVPILGAASAPNMSAITQLSGESGRWLEYVAVPPLKGPDGLQVTQVDPYQIAGGAFVITSAAKNPEAAFRLADMLYDRENTLRLNFGVLGKDWDWAAEGEKGINGEQAIYKTITKFGVQQNSNWSQVGPNFRPSELRLGEVADPENPLESILYKETKDKYDPYKIDTASVMPPLFFTSDQTAEMADLAKTLFDYVNEMTARFVTGDMELNDANWQNYLQTLDGMNLKRYLEIYQGVYDAKQK